jgi:hypothetical protein
MNEEEKILSEIGNNFGGFVNETGIDVFATLKNTEVRYMDLLDSLGVNGHEGAIAEINALRRFAKLDDEFLYGKNEYGQLPSLKSDRGILPCNEINEAIALLVNNGYRVEKIIRNDESLALSK